MMRENSLSPTFRGPVNLSRFVFWSALAAVMTIGVLGTLTLYRVIGDQALGDWHQRIENEGDRNAEFLSEWLEQSMDMIFAMEASFNASRWVEENQFMEVFESYEEKSPELSPNTIIFALPMRIGDGRIIWESQLSSDYSSPFVHGANLSRYDFIQAALAGARETPGQLVLGPIQDAPNQRLSAAAALGISNGSDAGVLLAILDFERILQGLQASMHDEGLRFRLFSRFVTGPKAQFDEVQVVGSTTPPDDADKIVTRRLSIGGHNLRLQLFADQTFLGGPKSDFSRAILASGLGGTVLVALFIAFLLSQNQTIKRRVAEATAEVNRSSEQLQEREERLNLALEGGNLGTWDINIETGEGIVNERWVNMLGYHVEDVGNAMEMWRQTLHPQDRDRVLAYSADYRKGLLPEYETEYRAVRKDGVVRWLLSKGKAVTFNDAGHASRMAGTVMDITLRKEMEEKLEKAMEAADQANQVKSAFLANMSHELRTPMNAILGYSEMLVEEAEDLGQEDFIPDLKKINQAGTHLLALTNDVLDLSKIESGKMEAFPEHINLDSLIDEVSGTAQPLMGKNSNNQLLMCSRKKPMQNSGPCVRQNQGP